MGYPYCERVYRGFWQATAAREEAGEVFARYFSWDSAWGELLDTYYRLEIWGRAHFSATYVDMIHRYVGSIDQSKVHMYICRKQ